MIRSFLNMFILTLAFFFQHSVNMHLLLLCYFKVQVVAASLAKVERALQRHQFVLSRRNISSGVVQSSE